MHWQKKKKNIFTYKKINLIFISTMHSSMSLYYDLYRTEFYIGKYSSEPNGY